jgi:hypothetical protein
MRQDDSYRRQPSGNTRTSGQVRLLSCSRFGTVHTERLLYARPEIKGFRPYRIAVSPGSAWADVIFVASGCQVLALTVQEPNLDGNLSFDSSRGSDPPPFTSDDEVPVDCRVVCTVETTGEVRGLSACGPFLFFCDNNGLAAIELPLVIPGSPTRLKATKLAHPTRSLAARFNVDLKHTKSLFAFPLSADDSAARNLHNYGVCLVNEGCLYVVPCQALAPAVLEIKLEGCIPAAAAYHADSRTLFVAAAGGNAIYKGTINLTASLSTVLRSGAEAMAASKTRTNGDPTTTVVITVDLAFGWSPLPTTHQVSSSLFVDICVSRSGAVFGCKTGSVASGVTAFARPTPPAASALQTPAVLRARTADVSPISAIDPAVAFGNLAAPGYLSGLTTIARKVSPPRCSNNECLQRIIAVAKYCEEARYWKVVD